MTLYMCLGQTLNHESKGRYLNSVNEPRAGIVSDGQDLFVPLTTGGSYVLCDFFIFFITEKTKIEIMSFVFC